MAGVYFYFVPSFIKCLAAGCVVFLLLSFGTSTSTPPPWDSGVASSSSSSSTAFSVSLLWGVSALTTTTTTTNTIILRRKKTSSSSRVLFQTSSDNNDENYENDNDSDNNNSATEAITGVTLKIAFDSAYGVGDLSEHKSERFTCDSSLDMVHRLRYDSDAVLVGRMTVQNDDCTLTIRRNVPLKKSSKNNNSNTSGHPVRVILDPNLSLDRTKYKIFNDGLQTIVYHCCEESHKNDDVVVGKDENVKLVYLPPSTTTQENKEMSSSSTSSPSLVSPRDICEHLSKHYNIHHVMVEGGPQTARLFLQEGGSSGGDSSSLLVDRAILVFAPFCFKQPRISNMTRETFENAGLELIYEGKLGVDRVEHWCKPGTSWPMKNTTFQKKTKKKNNDGDDDDDIDTNEEMDSDDASVLWP